MNEFTQADIDRVAASVIEAVIQKKAHGVTLTGNLGAGKTALAQAIARNLGVHDVVVSPTFVLMKRYDTHHDVFSSFIHVDAYRIESAPEAAGLKMHEYPEDAFICIEWPEHMHGALPAHLIPLTISYVSEDKRAIMGI